MLALFTRVVDSRLPDKVLRQIRRLSHFPGDAVAVFQMVLQRRLRKQLLNAPGVREGF